MIHFEGKNLGRTYWLNTRRCSIRKVVKYMLLETPSLQYNSISISLWHIYLLGIQQVYCFGWCRVWLMALTKTRYIYFHKHIGHMKHLFRCDHRLCIYNLYIAATIMCLSPIRYSLLPFYHWTYCSVNCVATHSSHAQLATWDISIFERSVSINSINFEIERCSCC